MSRHPELGPALKGASNTYNTLFHHILELSIYIRIFQVLQKYPKVRELEIYPQSIQKLEEDFPNIKIPWKLPQAIPPRFPRCMRAVQWHRSFVATLRGVLLGDLMGIEKKGGFHGISPTEMRIWWDWIGFKQPRRGSNGIFPSDITTWYLTN